MAYSSGDFRDLLLTHYGGKITKGGLMKDLGITASPKSTEYKNERRRLELLRSGRNKTITGPISERLKEIDREKNQKVRAVYIHGKIAVKSGPAWENRDPRGVEIELRSDEAYQLVRQGKYLEAWVQDFPAAVRVTDVTQSFYTDTGGTRHNFKP